MRLIFLLLSFLLTLSSSPVKAHEPEKQLSFEHLHLGESPRKYVHFAIKNNYFSEGRDNLEGASLLEASFGADWRKLSGRITYATSPDANYDQLELSFSATKEVDNFTLYTTYTHLEYLSDNLNDNEIGFGGVFSGLPANMGLGVDGHYSFDSHGSFWELSLTHQNNIHENFSFSQSAILGINQAYISDGHTGNNHFQLLIDAEYTINKKLSSIAYLGYSWAIDADRSLQGDETLINAFSSGIDWRWSF